MKNLITLWRAIWYVPIAILLLTLVGCWAVAYGVRRATRLTNAITAAIEVS